LGIGDWAQSPIPNPQSPIPNPQKIYYFFNHYKSLYFVIILMEKEKIFELI
jgi:hypothetical protein